MGLAAPMASSTVWIWCKGFVADIAFGEVEGSHIQIIHKKALGQGELGKIYDLFLADDDL